MRTDRGLSARGRGWWSGIRSQLMHLRVMATLNNKTCHFTSGDGSILQEQRTVSGDTKATAAPQAGLQNHGERALL